MDCSWNDVVVQVDAALDLSHTQNIGYVLKNHFAKSQFLVVSLKEGLFNNANVIYRYTLHLFMEARTESLLLCLEPISLIKIFWVKIWLDLSPHFPSLSPSRGMVVFKGMFVVTAIQGKSNGATFHKNIIWDTSCSSPKCLVRWLISYFRHFIFATRFWDKQNTTTSFPSSRIQQHLLLQDQICRWSLYCNTDCQHLQQVGSRVEQLDI